MDMLNNKHVFSVKDRYRIILNDHIEYRYQIINILGDGSYGNVIEVKDLKDWREIFELIPKKFKESTKLKK